MSIPRSICIIIISFVYGSASYAAAGDNPCAAVQFESCTSIGNITYTLSSTSNWTATGNGITDPSGTCLGTSSKDVNFWLCYKATQEDQSVIFNLYKPGGGGTIFDCGIQVFSASSCSSSFTLISCQNNSGDGHANTPSIAVTAGTTYYVRLFETSGNGSGDAFTASISITKNTTIGKTACNARTITSLPYSYNANTLCNTNTIAANCPGKTVGVTGSGEDYWFKYTSPGNEYISINLDGLNPAISQGIVVSNPVSSCSTAKTCYSSTASNGSFPGGMTGVSGTSSALCRTVYLNTAGDYYLIVDASSARGGSFTLSVSAYTPSNTSDACSWALGVTPTAASLTIDNCTATADQVPSEPANPLSAAAGPSGCGYTSENSKWFTIVTDNPAPPEIVVSLAGITCSYPDYSYTAGLEMGIFTGSCGGAWTKVGNCVSSASSSLSQTIVSPPAGQQFYIVVDGIGGSVCSFSISASNVVALPVTLLSFNAHFNGEQVELEWKTASESNTHSFIVERSYDGISYETVEIKNAAGSGSQPHEYTALDTAIKEGLIYYLLTKTDNDGNKTALKIASVNVHTVSKQADLTASPNPATSFTHLLLPARADHGRLYITDPAGKCVWQQAVSSSEESIDLQLAHYTAGMYFIILESGKEIMRTKLIKLEE